MVELLKLDIQQAFRSLCREHVIDACLSFRGHIQQVIDAEGSHIE